MVLTRNSMVDAIPSPGALEKLAVAEDIENGIRLIESIGFYQAGGNCPTGTCIVLSVSEGDATLRELYKELPEPWQLPEGEEEDRLQHQLVRFNDATDQENVLALMRRAAKRLRKEANEQE